MNLKYKLSDNLWVGRTDEDIYLKVIIKYVHLRFSLLSCWADWKDSPTKSWRDVFRHHIIWRDSYKRIYLDIILFWVSMLGMDIDLMKDYRSLSIYLLGFSFKVDCYTRRAVKEDEDQ